MSDKRSSTRKSMLKEELDLSPSWSEIILSEDFKGSKSLEHAHEAGILPPEYFELQSAAVPNPPPPPYGQVATGIRSTTRRWLICLSVGLCLLAIALFLVIFFAVRPHPASAAPSANSTTSVALSTAIVTVTASITLKTTVSSSSPLPTTLMKATTVVSFEPPRLTIGTFHPYASHAPPIISETEKKTTAKPSSSPSPSPSTSVQNEVVASFLFPAVVGGA